MGRRLDRFNILPFNAPLRQHHGMTCAVEHCECPDCGALWTFHDASSGARESVPFQLRCPECEQGIRRAFFEEEERWASGKD